MYVYMSISKLCCMLWGLQRHPLRLRNSHIRESLDLWWLGTGGECLKMSWWLRSYCAMSGTHTTIYNPISSLSHHDSDVTKSQQRKSKQPGYRPSFGTSNPPAHIRGRNTSTPDALYPFLPLPCSSALRCQILNEHLLNPSLRARGLGLDMWIHSGSHHSLNKFTEYS